MSKEDYLPLTGHFLLRGKGKGEYGNRAMMIGVLEGEDIEINNPDGLNHGEIWFIQFLILEKKRYKVPKHTYGMRADQFLCTAILMDELEEINSPKPQETKDEV